MNKQEKNIVDVLTFDEIEDIVDIFIDKLYHTDKTVALITNKELVEYAMDKLLNDDNITVRRVDLELDSEDAEYMISVDDDGYLVVQPIEYYDDKYFEAIEYAFVDMDGCVEQITIDNLLDRNVEIVLFGYEEDNESKYDKCSEYACKKDDKPATASSASSKSAKSTYKVNGKECDKETYDEALRTIEDMYTKNIREALSGYSDLIDEMHKWKKLLNW